MVLHRRHVMLLVMDQRVVFGLGVVKSIMCSSVIMLGVLVELRFVAC